MDEAEIIERTQQIEQIQKTLNGLESRLDGLLKSLNWQKDKLPQRKVKSSESEQIATVAPVPSSSYNCNNPVQATQQNTIDLNALTEICSTINKKKSAAETQIDLFKLKRDLKRRRMKYRTTKLTPLNYTEELRELINLQMDLLHENSK